MNSDAIQRRIEFVEQVLSNQRKTLRFQTGLSVGLVVLGFVAIVVGSLLVRRTLPGQFDWLPMVAGLFPPALSAFPLKEIFLKRDKISALVLLLREFESIKNEVGLPDPGRLARLEQRFDQLFDRLLGV